MEPTPSNFNPQKILETLDRNDVSYLVFGGFAGVSYGAQRATEDIDVVIKREQENFKNLSTALNQLNAQLRVAGLSDHEVRQLKITVDAAFLSQLAITNWRTDAGDLDTLPGLKQRSRSLATYEDLRPRSATIDAKGLVIRVASLADIIEAKETAARAKDLQALQELRALQPETGAVLITKWRHPPIGRQVASLSHRKCKRPPSLSRRGPFAELLSSGGS